MQILAINNSGINISCVLCGTKNVRTTVNGKDVSDQDGIDMDRVEIKFRKCPHFEGIWTNDGVEVDKNGIIQAALDKAQDSSVHSSDILKKQLDDTYVMFEYNSGPWSVGGYYLYHFNPDEE